MKNIAFLFFLLFFVPNVMAQKQTDHVFDAENIEKLVLESDEIYKISIVAAPVNAIVVTSKADGEYFNEIRLDPELKGNTLYLRSRFREILQSGFDKLSAHKVFAMELEIEVPTKMGIEVNSNVASVFIQGDYEQVLVELKSGSCFLKNFTGNATVNTYDGNIEVETTNTVVEASTRHGESEIAKGISGSHHILLTSINGNIKVQETK